MRIFSSAPGTYGTGVELAVASSSWQDEKDLAGVYFHWTGYAYGAGIYARKAQEEHRLDLSSSYVDRLIILERKSLKNRDICCIMKALKANR